MYRYIILGLYLCFPLKSISQPLKEFVDLHCHVVLKNYYRQASELQLRTDSVNCEQISLANWIDPYDKANLGRTSFNSIWGKSSANEATYDILADASMPSGIVCASLYTLEKQSASHLRVPINFVQFINALLLKPKEFTESSSNRISIVQKTRGLENLIRWELPDIIRIQFADIFIKGPIVNVKAGFLNSFAVTKLPYREQQIVNSSSNTNFQELMRQYNFLKCQEKSNRTDHQIIIAKNNTHLRQLIDSIASGKKITAIVLSVEGAHNFFGSTYSTAERINIADTNRIGDSIVLHNIDSFKNLDHRLFFVSPSHLFWNRISGHARGLDIEYARKVLSTSMWIKGFENADEKHGEGIIDTLFPEQPLITKRRLPTVCECDHGKKKIPTTLGWRVIKRLLDTTNKFHKSTFIDFRHSDPKARRQLIDSILVWNPCRSDSNQIPIIISHAAVSGKNEAKAAVLGLCPYYDNYKEYLNPKRYYLKKIKKCNKPYNACFCAKTGLTKDNLENYIQSAGWFHPMSNNLFDEEIEAVYQTHGIIGVTLEERALGGGTYLGPGRYVGGAYNYSFSNEHDIYNYFPSNYARIYGDNYFRNISAIDSIKFVDSLKMAEPFMRNVFYIVSHSNCTNSVECWKHVAVGTDFDGIINPIDICTRATEIPGFYQFLVRNYRFFEDYLNFNRYSFHCTPVQLMNMLFYENGEDFILKYF